MPELESDYPSFEQAVVKFVAFAQAQGLPPDLLFVGADDVLIAQATIFVRRLDPKASRELAERRYAEAVRRGLGVLIGGFCTMKGTTCAYVYGPEDDDEAARLMYPNGLKLSVSQKPREARHAGALTWLGLRAKRALFGNCASAIELLK